MLFLFVLYSLMVIEEIEVEGQHSLDIHQKIHKFSISFWLIIVSETNCRKQTSRGVLKKRCSENMHQIYRRTPMPRCDLQLYWNQGTPLEGCFWIVNLWNQSVSTKVIDRYLLVQNQQWKYQKNVWNLFKVNSKDTRTMSLASFWCIYC